MTEEKRDDLMDQQIRDMLEDESTLREEANKGAEEAREAGLEVSDEFAEPEAEEAEDETEQREVVGEDDEPKIEDKLPSELETLKAQNDALVEQLNAIQQHLSAQRQALSPKETDQEQLQFEEVDWIGDQKIDDLIDSKKELNALLNQVYKRALSDSTVHATKQALRALPEVTMRYVHNQFDVRGAIDRFWKAHPQLENAKPAVGAIANQVDIEYPDQPMDKKLEITAERAYKTLGIVKGAQRRSERKSPSLPGAGTRQQNRPQAHQISDMQKVINNIISTEEV